MKALIRKEISELAIPFGLLLLILSVVWIWDASLEAVLLAPRQGPVTAVLFTAGIVGLVVASVQFLGERTRGSLGFLLHRGPGHAGCFRAKVIVGMAVTWALAIVPPVVFALWHSVALGEARVIQWARLSELACLSTFGLSAYALAALALQLRRRLVVDIALASIGVVGLHLLSVASLELPGAISIAFARLALFHFVAASILLWLAGRAFHNPTDRELPLTSPIHASVLALSSLLIGPAALVVVTGLESMFAPSSQYPAQYIVVERTTGDVFRVSSPRFTGTEWMRLEGNQLVPDARLKNFDGSFMSTGDIAPLADPTSMDWTPAQRILRSILNMHRLQGRWSALSPWFTWPGYNSSLGRFRTECWLDPECGHVRVFGLKHGFERGREMALEDDQAPVELPFAIELGKPSNSGRFSEATAVVHSIERVTTVQKVFPTNFHMWGSSASYREDPEATKTLLVDPRDGTLTSFDRANFSGPVARVELPGGDRFVGTESLVRRSGLDLGWDINWPLSLIRGEHGIYEWTKDAFVPFDMTTEDRDVTREEAKALIQHWIVTTDPDPIRTRIEVREPKSGRVLLAYSLGPHGLGDQVQIAMVEALALLRSPIGIVVSYFRDTHGARPDVRSIDPFFEPLLMNESRVGLLMAALLAAAIQVISIVRLLRSRRATTIVIVLAALMILILGFTAWIVVRVLEPRRYKRVASPVQRAEETSLLIQSA